MIIFFKMYTQAVLIREYHQVKKNNNRSGTGRSKFALFDLIDGVLQDRPSTSIARFLPGYEWGGRGRDRRDGGESGEWAEEDNKTRYVYICIYGLHYVNFYLMTYSFQN